MTDISKQLSDYQNGCFWEQQKLLDDWFCLLQGKPSYRSMNPWQQSISMAEKFFDSLVDNQKKSLRMLVNNKEYMKNVPEPYLTLFTNLVENIEQWYNLQQDFSHMWFNTLRATGQFEMSDNYDFAKNWQENMQRFLESQLR